MKIRKNDLVQMYSFAGVDKDKLYKADTIKNKRVVNNRLLETVHVVSVDLIQRYFKIYETTQQTAEMSYNNTYKLMQEFCAIIQYFNDLQEEKYSIYAL